MRTVAYPKTGNRAGREHVGERLSLWIDDNQHRATQSIRKHLAEESETIIDVEATRQR